jgi:hypothetical protein
MSEKPVTFENLPPEIIYEISRYLDQTKEQHMLMFCLNKNIREVMISNGFRVFIDKRLHLYNDRIYFFHKHFGSLQLSVEETERALKVMSFNSIQISYDLFETLSKILESKSLRTLILHDKGFKKHIIESIRGNIEVLYLSIYGCTEDFLSICLNRELNIRRKLCFGCHLTSGARSATGSTTQSAIESTTKSAILEIKYHQEIEKIKLFIRGFTKIIIPKCKVLCISLVEEETYDLSYIPVEDIILEYPMSCKSIKVNCLNFFYYTKGSCPVTLSNICFSGREQINTILLNAYSKTFVSHFSITGPKVIKYLKVACYKEASKIVKENPVEINLHFETKDPDLKIENLEISYSIDTNSIFYIHTVNEKERFYDFNNLKICLSGNCGSVSIDEFYIRSDNSEERQEYTLISRGLRTDIKTLKMRKNSKLNMECVYVKNYEYFENWYDKFLQYYGDD